MADAMPTSSVPCLCGDCFICEMDELEAAPDWWWEMFVRDETSVPPLWFPRGVVSLE